MVTESPAPKATATCIPKECKLSGKAHPLDPLSGAEIREAAAACRVYAKTTHFADTPIRFNVISLQEPKKPELLAYQRRLDANQEVEGFSPPRQAFCILQSSKLAGVIEVVVELGSSGDPGEMGNKVISWKEVPGAQALITPDDCVEAEAIAKSDPEVQRLLRERYGVTDLSLVCCDPWSVHASPLPSSRIIQCFTYLKLSPQGNQYAHPVDMVPIVDMTAGKVVRIDLPLQPSPGEAASAVPWNRVANEYHSGLLTETAPDAPKPISVTQPQGPSFRVQGNEVTWQKWSFRLGFNYREGVVLHDVKWQEGEEARRPVLHRLSLVEMAVPYADPREPFVRKCAFDVGDYGLGYCTFPLSLGCDCKGHIQYFDSTLSNSQGEPVVVSKAVCMHEEDAGLLYKHVDIRSGHSESRRMRRLVISHIATVVNYEYAFYWYLYQDGTVSLDIKLTGELSTNMLSQGEVHPEYGTLVGPGVNAQHHQHMFCVRIDPSVDDAEGGKQLVVTEVNIETCPWDALTNPHGNAFRVHQTDLTRIHQAQRCINPSSGRHWKIQNPSVLNEVTHHPVGYKLVPSAHPPLLAQPTSLTAHKGWFASKQLWVTPFAEEQRWPAGAYVVGAKECSGLKEWTAEDANLQGSDPVIWYSFGVTHIVRPEDFPIMPVEVCGFSLKPCGFFSRNPCLDLPQECDLDSKEACCLSNGQSHA